MILKKYLSSSIKNKFIRASQCEIYLDIGIFGAFSEILSAECIHILKLS